MDIFNLIWRHHVPLIAKYLFVNLITIMKNNVITFSASFHLFIFFSLPRSGIILLRQNEFI